MPDWVVWIVIAVVAFVVEATTTAFFAFYFGVAAAVVAVAAALGLSQTAQVIGFGAIAVGGLLVTRPWLVRLAGDDSPAVPTGVDAMRGRVGVVTAEIGELESGLARIDGEVWTARSYYEREAIGVGTRIEVVEIRGVTALVIPAPDGRELPKET